MEWEARIRDWVSMAKLNVRIATEEKLFRKNTWIVLDFFFLHTLIMIDTILVEFTFLVCMPTDVYFDVSFNWNFDINHPKDHEDPNWVISNPDAILGVAKENRF